MYSFWLLLLHGAFIAVHAKFEPNWDSLDTRKAPVWYDQAKIGVFLHWGVYSVPSFGSEWFWQRWTENYPEFVEFMNKNYPPNFTYQDFAKEFTAELFNASEWGDLFARAGAKYVVLTSKHHEGFALWPSKYSYSWNANDVGPHRDLVEELATAVRARNLHFGLYHSLFEWYNPIYEADRAINFTTSFFIDNKVIPEMKELVNAYKPEILWSDGDGGAPDTYWKSTEFLAWLYNDSPVRDVVLTNDRWGNNDIACKHGDFYSCDDRFNPGVLQPHKWENAMTVDSKSWGYRRNANLNDILTINDLIATLVETVSCGGNILINVGPTKEGTIVPIFQERLLQLGQWLSINGEAIYESDAWTVQNDTVSSAVWYTEKQASVYAFVLFWPKSNIVNLGSANSLFEGNTTTVTLLGNKDELKWIIERNEVKISLPDKATVSSEWVWVIKMTPVIT